MTAQWSNAICKLIILTCLLSAVSARNLWSVFRNEDSWGTDEEEVCQTEKCRLAADFIKKGMNRSADPCENFYEYACGSWPINFPLPPKKAEWNVDEIVQKDINDMRRRVLEEDIKPTDTKLLQLEKQWYKSCMDLDTIEKVGLTPLLDTINAIGGWPLIMKQDAWDDKKYSWQSVDAYYANLTGRHSLFLIDIDADITNSSNSMLFVDQPEENLLSCMNAESDNNKDFIINYSDVMVPVIKILSRNQGVDLIADDIAADFANMIYFGLNLTDILVKDAVRLDYERWLNYMTIAELQKYYNKAKTTKFTSKIDWLETIQVFLSDVNVTVTESDVLTVREPEYLRRLARLLNRTSSRTIVNYIHWMYIKKMMSYTNKELSDLSINLYQPITDPEDFPERWETCLKLNMIETGTSREFVKRNISAATIEAVKNVAENVRRQLAIEIEKSDWLDEDTKLKSIEKVNAMEVRIAYPKFYDNLTEFNQYADDLTMGPNFYENAVNMMLFSKRNTYESLREPFDKDEWVFEPTVSNAYYLHSSNSLTILAAEITLPIFDSTLPKSLNYGSIGFISGHEMSHGFDSSGRKYNKEGNLIPWWPKSMVEVYDTKVECIVEQFNNYSTDGNLTINENTADNLGMIAAFGAYKRFLETEKDKKLPGLEDITSDQMFFLSFASTFCTTTKADPDENDDVHSLPPIRINGAIANSKGFADAYQCENRTPKCSIWK